MERILHRAGLLEHEEQFAAAIGELELVLRTFRVDVLQFELGGGQHLGQPVKFRLS